jgi:hypothetical protein
VLWITGLPGMGKSVLAKFLDCRLRQESPIVGINRHVISFLSSKRDSNLVNNSILILKAMIHQFLMVIEGLAVNHVTRVHERHGNHLYESFYALWEIFTNIVSDPAVQDMYCIFDALDECKERPKENIFY